MHCKATDNAEYDKSQAEYAIATLKKNNPRVNGIIRSSDYLTWLDNYSNNLYYTIEDFNNITIAFQTCSNHGSRGS